MFAHFANCRRGGKSDHHEHIRCYHIAIVLIQYIVSVRSQSDNTSTSITRNEVFELNRTLSALPSILEPYYFGSQLPPSLNANHDHLYVSRQHSQFQDDKLSNLEILPPALSNPQELFYTLTNVNKANQGPFQPQISPEQRTRLANTINTPDNQSQLEQVILHSPEFKIQHSNEPLDTAFKNGDGNFDQDQVNNNELRIYQAQLGLTQNPAFRHPITDRARYFNASRSKSTNLDSQSRSMAPNVVQQLPRPISSKPTVEQVGYHSNQIREPNLTGSENSERTLRHPVTRVFSPEQGGRSNIPSTPRLSPYKPPMVTDDHQVHHVNLTSFNRPTKTSDYANSTPPLISGASGGYRNGGSLVRARETQLDLTPSSLSSRSSDRVSVSEIEDILRRLKPLAMNQNEKVSTGKLIEQDDDKGEKENGDTDDQNPISDHSDTTNNSNEADQVFLKSLSDLSDHLHRQQALEDEDRSDKFYNQNLKSLHPAKAHSEKRSTASRALGSIPIEVLVDHLMSGSRLASFGVQHNNVGHPDASQQEATQPIEEFEDEEEEDDDDDQDSNGTLPLDSQESAINLSRVSDPNSLNFSSILDHTNSWVPLGDLPLGVSATKKLRPYRESEQSLSLGESLTQKLKKRRTEKRDRPKRLKVRTDSGIIIGNRKLSRRDLISLIKLLNKMASRSEASKEREASRRLLRFLIKLALENYKKANKYDQHGTEADTGGSEDEKIRIALGSLLISPQKEDQSAGSDTIVLRPVGVRIEVTERPAKSNDSSQKSEGVNKRSFENVSNDLEQYLDGEFFEDLADKNVSSPRIDLLSSLDPLKLRSLSDANQSSHRLTRSKYRLPVPIYGEQHIEAADEDDVELDHVRIVKPSKEIDQQVDKISKERKPPRALRKRKYPKIKKQQRKRGRRAKGDRTKRGHRRQKTSRADKDRGIGERVERNPHKSLRRSRVPDRKRFHDNIDETADQKRELPQSSNNEEETGHGGDSEVPEEEGDAQHDSEEDDDAVRDEGTRVEKKMDIKPSRKSKRLADIRRRRKGTSSNMEFSRDDIPAPIVASGTGPPESSQNISAKVMPKTAKKEPVPVRSTIASSRQPRIKSKGSKSNSPEIEGRRFVGNKHGPKKTRKSKNVRVQPEDDLDSDYYNEGTSYSNVCDDDGKCQVTVRSNNPNIGKAIDANNDSAIVKQLGKWIENPDE